MGDGDRLARLSDVLDAAAAQAETANDIESRLQQRAKDTADEVLAEDLRRLAVAFAYYPTGGTDPFWGPMIVLRDGRQYPANLDALGDDLPALWIAVLAASAPTIARARLADLLWSRREGQRPFLFAQQAIDAYLDLASQTRTGVERLYQVQDAGRAIALARELRDTSRIDLSAQTLIALANKELDEADPAPGVVLRALEPLVPDCPTALVEERQNLLQQVITTYESDPFNFQSANELYAATLPPADRPAVHASIVERWDTAANTANGLMQLLHLERAIELAKLHDLPTMLDALRVKAQRIDPDALGMTPVRSEGHIAAMDEMLALLVHPTWPQTLNAIGTFGPLTGTRESNMQAVAQQREAAPFKAAISHTRLGFANSIIWRADPNTEARDRVDLAETESFRARYSAVYVMAALDLAVTRVGRPNAEQLATALTTDHVPGAAATRFAKAITLYFDGDYEMSALQILPSIEACIRHLNSQAGLPVTVEPAGVRPGGVRTLGTLITQLTGVLDRDWCRHLENVLTDPLGLNLRNRALHGILDVVTQTDAALLIHIVCFLSTLRATEASMEKPDNE